TSAAIGRRHARPTTTARPCLSGESDRHGRPTAGCPAGCEFRAGTDRGCRTAAVPRRGCRGLWSLHSSLGPKFKQGTHILIDTTNARRVPSQAQPAIGGGRGEDDGIHHVEHTAEAGHYLRRIFAPAIALNQGFRQVAEGTDAADDEAEAGCGEIAA